MARDRASIISRIKACLKYADPKLNPNSFERATAKRLADSLIKKHKVHPDELSVSKNGDWDVMISVNGTSIWSGMVPPSTGERVRRASSEEEVADIFKKSGIKPTERGWGAFESQMKTRPCDVCLKSNKTVKFYPADDTHVKRNLCSLCEAGEYGEIDE
jgi:hypothetical protein